MLRGRHVLRIVAAAALLAVLAACGPRNGEIVVVVQSTLAVPVELDAIEFRVTGAVTQVRPQPLVGPGARSLPLVLPLEGNGRDEDVQVEVRGLRNGVVVIHREAVVRFAPYTRRVLDIGLTRACVGVFDRCVSPLTCDDGNCRPIDLRAVALSSWTGGPPAFDAGSSPVPACAAACATYASPPRRFETRNLGTPGRITGVTLSRRFPNTFYIVSEARTGSYVLQINGAGVVLATYQLVNERGPVATARSQWEDLTVADSPDGPALYVLDALTDEATDSCSLPVIHRAAEPRAMPLPGAEPVLLQTVSMAFTFPDPIASTESITVGQDGALYVVSNFIYGSSTRPCRPPGSFLPHLYRVPWAPGSGPVVATSAGQLTVPGSLPRIHAVKTFQLDRCNPRALFNTVGVQDAGSVDEPNTPLMFEYRSNGGPQPDALIGRPPALVPLDPIDWGTEAAAYAPDGVGYFIVNYADSPVLSYVGCE